MKYFLYAFFSLITFSPVAPEFSLIKEIIICLEMKTLKETKEFVILNDYYLKDSSSEQDKSYILAYKKRATGEAIGIEVKQAKITMMSYFVVAKEDYDTVKKEIEKLGFKGDKPYQNKDEGIIEEIGYQKNKTLVIASYRKNKKDIGDQYDFIITQAF